MGVEWFDCDICGRGTPDCDSPTIEFENCTDTLYICSGCYDELIRDGYMSRSETDNDLWIASKLLLEKLIKDCKEEIETQQNKIEKYKISIKDLES